METGGTTTWRGTTVPEDRPRVMVAAAGRGPGLARYRFTVDWGTAVVCANRHVVDNDGEPSRSDIPPVGPDDHCWSSEATRPPAWATTMVAMEEAEAPWT